MKTSTAIYAEFIGTFAMVFCGTAAMAVNETTGEIDHELSLIHISEPTRR